MKQIAAERPEIGLVVSLLLKQLQDEGEKERKRKKSQLFHAFQSAGRPWQIQKRQASVYGTASRMPMENTEHGPRSMGHESSTSRYFQQRPVQFYMWFIWRLFIEGESLGEFSRGTQRN